MGGAWVDFSPFFRMRVDLCWGPVHLLFPLYGLKSAVAVDPITP